MAGRRERGSAEKNNSSGRKPTKGVLICQVLGFPFSYTFSSQDCNPFWALGKGVTSAPWMREIDVIPLPTVMHLTFISASWFRAHLLAHNSRDPVTCDSILASARDRAK